MEEAGQPKADRTASRLSVEYSRDAVGVLPKKVFYKFNTNGRDGVSEPRHCAAVREALFYSEFDRDGSIGPECYDTGGDFETGEVCLILQDITEDYVMLDKADVPSPYGGWASFETVTHETYGAIAEKLARFQALWWDNPRIQASDVSSYTGDMLSLVYTATDEFVRKKITEEAREEFIKGITRYGEEDPGASADLVWKVISGWPALYNARVSQANLTMMHCDLHLRNVLFPASGVLDPLFVDWEGLTTGIGIADLTHLLVSSMLSAEYLSELECGLVERCHSTLVGEVVDGYSLEDC